MVVNNNIVWVQRLADSELSFAGAAARRWNCEKTLFGCSQKQHATIDMHVAYICTRNLEVVLTSRHSKCFYIKSFGASAVRFQQLLLLTAHAETMRLYQKTIMLNMLTFFEFYTLLEK